MKEFIADGTRHDLFVLKAGLQMKALINRKSSEQKETSWDSFDRIFDHRPISEVSVSDTSHDQSTRS